MGLVISLDRCDKPYWLMGMRWFLICVGFSVYHLSMIAEINGQWLLCLLLFHGEFVHVLK